MGDLRQTLLAAGLLAAALPVFAQESDPGARLLEETRRQRQMEELARTPAGQEVTTPDAKGPVVESPCFPVDAITVTGSTIYSEVDFAPILAGFAGQCLGQASITNLLARLTALYADAGYITTRAYVPAQDISTRHLTIEVLEGRIEAYGYQQVDAEGNARPGPPRKVTSALPQRPGEVFQLRDLEHGLEQMNRLRSSEVNANLTAGEAPGTSRIILSETKTDTIRGTIGVNSRGSEATGRTQVSIGLEADDLLRLNDAWTLSYSGSRDTNALAFGVSVPYRKWLFSLNGSYSEELSPVTATSDLFTQTASVNLTAERLLYRNARSKYFVYGTISSYWNERYINIVALTPQQRSAVRLGLRQEHRLEKAVISADTSLSFGSRALGADWEAAGLPSGNPRADFAKLETRLTYIRPFESGRQLSMSLVGQMANRPLYGNEQLSIGGWDSVRGYAGFSVAGDSGVYLRSELSFPSTPLDLRKLGDPLGESRLNPFREAQGGIRSFAFVDAGHVYARTTGAHQNLFSVGLGLSTQVGKTTLNGALAIPLKDAGGQKAGDVQAWIGLTLKAF
ncbi:MAG: ShlB/FhaC/HecB family hemolysin secretion/activation protein [Paracoccaceae bacterium]|nr:ShlB/FhaC/HecB family hemolysin secretion/activation protein [Paracoccaceae bacterium]